jgi:hypothetical protein
MGVTIATKLPVNILLPFDNKAIILTDYAPERQRSALHTRSVSRQAWQAATINPPAAVDGKKAGAIGLTLRDSSKPIHDVCHRIRL